jgi:NADH:ubiquinone oxidoreductase subunit C
VTPDSVAAALRRHHGRAEADGDGVRCEVDPDRLGAVLGAVRDELGFALLSSITAVDEGESIRLLYHLARIDDPEFTGLLLLEVRALRGDHPDGPLVPSAVPVYPGANLQEREIFDLMGVRFRGHPNLTRVLTWTGFHGHPLRKDYQPIDEEIPWRLAGLAGPDGTLIDAGDAALAGDERAMWEPIPVDALVAAAPAAPPEPRPDRAGEEPPG